MFAATAAAEALRERKEDHDVVVFEGTRRTMTKVSISGGGRCNVLHDTTKPIRDIIASYPRGSKELTGLFHKHFTPRDARRWFESRGVVLKTEADGRVFPVTDDSATIVDAIASAAGRAGVRVERNRETTSVARSDDGDEEGLVVSFQNEDEGSLVVDAVVLATGSSRSGHALAASLGHTIVTPVPSLFTLNASKEQINGGVLDGLAGVSVPSAEIALRVAVAGRKKKKMISQRGPLLVTHRGVSGPGPLRLSAFAAREFHDLDYRTSDVTINWIPFWRRRSTNVEEVRDALWEQTKTNPRRTVASSCPLTPEDDDDDAHDDDGGGPSIPKRLWAALVVHSGFDRDTTWAEARKKNVGALARNLFEFRFDMSGRGVFKEEFVTAGGVKLKEIRMELMASRKCEGLFLCGEVVDVDGVTGGFNFMNCWSTGYLAGNSAAEYVCSPKEEEKKKKKKDVDS